MSAGFYRYDIPLPSDGPKPAVVIVAGVWPLTPDQWSHFMHILGLYRAGLVEEPAPPVPEDRREGWWLP